MQEKLLIPLQDYLRIHSVIRAVLDGLNAHTAFACKFFSAAGAQILRHHYGLNANPLAGAAFYLVDEEKRYVLSFAKIHDGIAVSSDDAFHAWVDCNGYATDFMAPIFPENCRAMELPFVPPRRMFQKKMAHMASSHESLLKAGDFYLAPNFCLTADLAQTFIPNRAQNDLVNVCVEWYRKPPRSIKPTLRMINDLGKLTRLKLIHAASDGVW